MSFLREFIHHCTNRVVIVRIKKIDDEVHRHVLSTFDEHRKKYQQIIVTIIENLEAMTDVTILNILIDDDFHFKSIIISSDNL